MILEADFGNGAPSSLRFSVRNPDMMTDRLIHGRDEADILSP
jgi:hypothetical protein